MRTKQNEAGEMVTTTVSLDKATYKRLQHLAVDRDTNVRELIREAVANLLGSKERTVR
jgi:predicted transcriptional regulator